MITLDIPAATPSNNKLLRMHWRAKEKIRADWQWMVKAAVLNDRIRVTSVDHAHVTIARFGPKLLDMDNFIAGTKYLMDSLVKEGFMADDSPAHLTATYVQHLGKRRTLIHIEAANGTGTALPA